MFWLVLVDFQEMLLNLEGEYLSHLEPPHPPWLLQFSLRPCPQVDWAGMVAHCWRGYTWLFENLLFAWNEACYGNKVWWLESRAPLKNAKPVCALGEKGARRGLSKLRLPRFFSEGGVGKPRQPGSTFLPQKEERAKKPGHTSQPSSGLNSLLPLMFGPSKQLRTRYKLVLHPAGAHTRSPNCGQAQHHWAGWGRTAQVKH